jgi:hypothetical protein
MPPSRMPSGRCGMGAYADPQHCPYLIPIDHWRAPCGDMYCTHCDYWEAREHLLCFRRRSNHASI